MKNSKQIVLGLVAISLLGALAWRAMHTPASSPEQPADASSTQPAAVQPMVPQQPIADQTERALAQNSEATPPRKFRDISGREQRAIMAEIRKQDFSTMLQLMLDAGRIENDPVKQSAICTVIWSSMQQRPPPSEFLEQLRAFIADESNPPTERRQMVGILSDASIEETAVLLVRFATTQQDRVLRDMATTGIAGLGNYGPRDFVFPMLEPVWRAASEPKLLDAVAMAIANGGAPAGTELLLESALLESGRDDVRRRAAVIALTKVQTRNAVPPLAKLLIATEPGTPANTLSFNTLRQIGDPTAAQALISWLQSTDERSAPMAREWTAHLRTEIEYKAAQAALDPAVPFRNEANRNALRQGLADFDRSRRTLP